ncbi:VOC family protein [bacterium]|nr:VOC family protein [candidate division CSSED10-310 bacterium]
MPTINVRDLNVLAVYASNFQRSVAFYTDHLGFEKVEDMPPGILMKAGAVMLYIEAGKVVEPETGPSPGGFCPCFAVDSVKESYQALREAGVRISTPYQEFGPAFALFRITDPDGNVIEFAGSP